MRTILSDDQVADDALYTDIMRKFKLTQLIGVQRQRRTYLRFPQGYGTLRYALCLIQCYLDLRQLNSADPSDVSVETSSIALHSESEKQVQQREVVRNRTFDGPYGSNFRFLELGRTELVDLHDAQIAD